MTDHDHCPTCGKPSKRLTPGLPYVCYFCGSHLIRLHCFGHIEYSQWGINAPWTEAVNNGYEPLVTKEPTGAPQGK